VTEIDMNTNKRKALEALLATPSVAAAARRCGLAERTLWRYLNDAAFKAALDSRLDTETRALTAALGGLSSKAIEALHDLVTDPETPPSVRARVALGWLDKRGDVIELSQLSERVSKLEAKRG